MPITVTLTDTFSQQYSCPGVKIIHGCPWRRLITIVILALLRQSGNELARIHWHDLRNITGSQPTLYNPAPLRSHNLLRWEHLNLYNITIIDDHDISANRNRRNSLVINKCSQPRNIYMLRRNTRDCPIVFYPQIQSSAFGIRKGHDVINNLGITLGSMLLAFEFDIQILFQRNSARRITFNNM